MCLSSTLERKTAVFPEIQCGGGPGGKSKMGLKENKNLLFLEQSP